MNVTSADAVTWLSASETDDDSKSDVAPHQLLLPAPAPLFNSSHEPRRSLPPRSLSCATPVDQAVDLFVQAGTQDFLFDGR